MSYFDTEIGDYLVTEDDFELVTEDEEVVAVPCDPLKWPPFYRLMYNSLTLVNSSRMIEYKSNWQRLTDIQKRQNYWSNEVILDGRYPALYHQHEFTLFTEAADRDSYVARYYNVPRSFVSGTAGPLQIVHPDGLGTIVDFGECLLDGSSQDNPQDLLMYEAGIIRVRFLGTVIPSVCQAVTA